MIVVPVAGLYDGFELRTAQAFDVSAGLTTIGEHSLGPVDGEVAFHDTHIAFTLDLPNAASARLELALATPRWWTELSGAQPPPPSVAGDAYGGERLP